MEVFRKRFRQAIGESLRQDGMVIIVFLFESARQFVRAQPRRDRKGAEIIGPAGTLRSDKIGQAIVWLSGRLCHLLAEEMKLSHRLSPCLVGIDFNLFP